MDRTRELTKKFVDENKDSPLVQEAMRLARNSETRKALLESQPKTWDRAGDESWQEFQPRNAGWTRRRKWPESFRLKISDVASQKTG